MRAAGIVLAGGASQRMGSPKALLRGLAGTPLAERQARLLRAGGCEPVAVVAGAHAPEIRRALPAGIPVVDNPCWAEGRVTSLQTGIRAFPEADGWLFLPVDAAGVKVATIRAVLAAAAQSASIWRPVYGGGKGNILWVPQAWGAELCRLAPGARVDEWARPQARQLEVDDPAILRNLNTPAEWAEFVRAEPDPGLSDGSGQAGISSCL